MGAWPNASSIWLDLKMKMKQQFLYSLPSLTMNNKRIKLLPFVFSFEMSHFAVRHSQKSQWHTWLVQSCPNHSHHSTPTCSSLNLYFGLISSIYSRKNERKFTFCFSLAFLYVSAHVQYKCGSWLERFNVSQYIRLAFLFLHL